ncbi:uncharacterized protein LODBEIA_P14590 [Lodderomyces beijingensis]|uniref:Uncharacterized protein n=1 Tax=Lodderomyces beijingensis TaxID=1775926 RepID=A0ABP0ZJ51_9ASCO
MAGLRTVLLGLIIFYSTYLYNYKCSKLTPIQEVENVVFSHPLNHQHQTLCELLHGGVDKVEPYLVKTKGFLDEHVHSHPLFIKLGIHEKAECAQAQFKAHVYPFVEQLYEYTESFEANTYDQLNEYYQKAQQFVSGKLKQD